MTPLDNIPGVPSVGPKTAKDLLVEFGTLDGIYQRIDELKKKGLKDKLIEHKDQAFLSQQLVKLKDDCPIIIDQAHLAYGGRDIPALKALYAELGFQRQLQALSNEPEAATGSQASFALQPGSQPISASSRPAASTKSPPAAPVGAPEISLITTKEELASLANELREAKGFSIAVETSTPNTLRSALVGVALAWQPGKAVYLPVGIATWAVQNSSLWGDLHELLGPLFADGTVAKSALDLKRVDVILTHAGSVSRVTLSTRPWRRTCSTRNRATNANRWCNASSACWLPATSP